MSILRTVLLCMLSSACTSQRAPLENAPPDASSAESAPSRFVPIIKPEDSSILQAPAVVRASPAAFGEVTAPTPLRIARVHVQVGEAVSAGDPMVDVYARDVLDAAAMYLSSGARAQSHDARADQLEALLDEGLVLRAQVFEQRSTAADLRASRLQSIAVLRSSGVDPKEAPALIERGFVTLRAPVTGIVTELSARLGRSYQPGATPIARITGQALARIEVQTARRWPDATAVVFTGVDGRQIMLEPTPVASVVIPADGTIRSWFDPQEPVDLPDGLIGTAQVFAAKDVWEVPAASIRQQGDRSMLMRRRDDRSERIEIEVVAASGASALIRGPLEAGDLIAIAFPDGDGSGSDQ